MQKIVILSDNPKSTSLEKLNADLNDNWTVVHMCPMPSAVSRVKPYDIQIDDKSNFQDITQIFPTCAVVLEKLRVKKL